MSDRLYFVPKWKHPILEYSSEYRSWQGARSRCTKPKHKSWSSYGGRGIRMCDAWLNDFDQFIYDMGSKPSPDLTIERLDVNGNYEPGNCVWATVKEQSRNRRSNNYIGKETITEYAKRTGINQTTLSYRIANKIAPEVQREKAKHGSRTRYQRYKCRCKECVSAENSYQRNWRAKTIPFMDL